MRRLLQFGAVMMLIGAIVPVIELFDQWDAPGLSNDTEYAVYAFIFAICLVLLLSKLVASDVLRFGFAFWRIFLRDDGAIQTESAHTSIFAVPLLSILPLRI